MPRINKQHRHLKHLKAKREKQRHTERNSASLPLPAFETATPPEALEELEEEEEFLMYLQPATRAEVYWDVASTDDEESEEELEMTEGEDNVKLSGN